MTTWFVTRHPGAIEWAQRQGLRVDRQTAHLDIAEVSPGDTVIGILPVKMAAQVCERGARYLALAVDVPPEARGRELSADELQAFGAALEEFSVRAVPNDSRH